MGKILLSSYSALSKGKKRKYNEDSLLIYEPKDKKVYSKKGYLYIVADGVGGLYRGDVASKTAVETIKKEYYLSKSTDISKALVGAIKKANSKIYSLSKKEEKMGTTVVCVVIKEDKAYIANAGDSRAYIFRGGKLKKITEDHSFVGERVRAGELTEEQARIHPRKNIILKCLGYNKKISIDIKTIKLKEKDRVLLCSDGLWGELPDKEIGKILKDYDSNTVRRLINNVYEAGASDNISIILIDIFRFNENKLNEFVLYKENTTVEFKEEKRKTNIKDRFSRFWAWNTLVIFGLGMIIASVISIVIFVILYLDLEILKYLSERITVKFLVFTGLGLLTLGFYTYILGIAKFILTIKNLKNKVKKISKVNINWLVSKALPFLILILFTFEYFNNNYFDYFVILIGIAAILNYYFVSSIVYSVNILTGKEPLLFPSSIAKVKRKTMSSSMGEKIIIIAVVFLFLMNLMVAGSPVMIENINTTNLYGEIRGEILEKQEEESAEEGTSEETSKEQQYREINNISYTIIYGPNIESGYCVYRVRVDITGDYKSIRWNRDDSNGAWGSDVAQINISPGESFNLKVYIDNYFGGVEIYSKDFYYVEPEPETEDELTTAPSQAIYSDGSWDNAVICDFSPPTNPISGAQWIWEPGWPQTCTVSKTFNIDGNINNATIKIAVDNFYILYINGSEVGRKDSDPTWDTADTYNIKSYLHSGSNTVSVNGWNEYNQVGISVKIQIN